MNLHCLGAALLLLAIVVTGAGQSADDRYVHVYSLIEDADKLSDGGQTRQAMTKYLEAQVAIKDLQQSFPEWNKKIIAYRLSYISSRLEPLAKKTAASAEGGARSDGGAAPSAQPPANPLQTMQEEIGRLAAQNALLEAKLREALRVQPAAVDPRELAKAEEKIKGLQKERDLLAVTLRQSSSSGPSAAAGQANATSVESKQQLVTQGAVVSVLQKQNEDLQKQITELAAKLKSGKGGGTEVSSLRETVAELEARNRVMKEEQAMMENRLLDFVKRFGSGSAGSSAKEKELENQLVAAQAAAKAAQQERDELLAKLNAVTQELNQRGKPAPAARTEQLEKELEGIRAKLQIFEAKAVPYTAEELVLFKQAPIKVAAAQTTNAPPGAAPGKQKSYEIPPGAGTLFAEAQRAVDGGRFDEAEKKYREVLRQDEGNVRVMANLAAVLMDLEKVDEADRTLKRALEIDPEDSVSLYLRGGLQLRQEKYEEALASLSLSARIAPDVAQTQYYLAKALIQKGDRSPAEAALRKAIQLKPGWGDAHYVLAVLYGTQQPNYKELAQYHYKKAIANGAARNVEFEQWLEKPGATTARQ
jgi:tetratricopeptide (TPR) repeat protein